MFILCDGSDGQIIRIDFCRAIAQKIDTYDLSGRPIAPIVSIAEYEHALVRIGKGRKTRSNDNAICAKATSGKLLPLLLGKLAYATLLRILNDFLGLFDLIY